MSADLEKLSLLIPLAGIEKVQVLLQRQLTQWTSTQLDTTINKDTFSAYQMLAGLNVKQYGGLECDNNVLASYDWRRAFGFFLTFSTIASDTIARVAKLKRQISKIF